MNSDIYSYCYSCLIFLAFFGGGLYIAFIFQTTTTPLAGPAAWPGLGRRQHFVAYFVQYYYMYVAGASTKMSPFWPVQNYD